MTRIGTFALVLTCAAIQSPAAVERCDLAAFTTLNSSSVTIRAAERVDAGPTIASATVDRTGLQARAHCRVQASVSAAPRQRDRYHRLYERVRAKQGSQGETDRFFRLFMVPGMVIASEVPARRPSTR